MNTTSGVSRGEMAPQGSSLAVGIGGAILGSLCCAAPAAAFAFGIAGAAGLVAFTRFQQVFLVASLVLVLLGSWLLARRRAACCVTASERTKALYTVPLTAGLTYLAVYLAINELLVPLLYGLGSQPMAH